MFLPPFVTFLCIFGATSSILSFIIDFPPIPDNLCGLGDFGDLGDTTTTTFAFDDFGLKGGEAVLRQTGMGTSSTTEVIVFSSTSTLSRRSYSCCL